MPLGGGVSIRPLRFAGEERTLQLKVDPGAAIPPHRHAGWVHAYNVSGSRWLDNGEIAGPGAYVYEPGGNADTWGCHGDEPCVVQVTMSGRLSYVDGSGAELDYTDSEKLRRQYLDWCRENGFEPQALGSGG